MSDFYWRQGDTASDFTETLRDEDGNPVDIAGADARLVVTPLRSGTETINAAMTNLQNGDGSDGSKGQVRYTPVSGDTDTPGDYLASIHVTFASGQVQTFPNSGYILITITPSAASQQRRYVGIEDYKQTLSLQQLTFADADIDIAVEAASRGIEEAYGGPWTLRTPGEQRYYTRADERTVSLDGAIAISEVALDYTLGDFFDRRWGYDPFAGGGGTYATIIQPGTDYRLLPIISGLSSLTPPGNGEPYTELELVRGASVRRLPSGVDAIRITGTFGWEIVPAGVVFATKLTATRFLRRMREAPFGIVALGLEGAVARVREITSDPDIKMAMDGVTGGSRSLVV